MFARVVVGVDEVRVHGQRRLHVRCPINSATSMGRMQAARHKLAYVWRSE